MKNNYLGLQCLVYYNTHIYVVLNHLLLMHNHNTHIYQTIFGQFKKYVVPRTINLYNKVNLISML